MCKMVTISFQLLRFKTLGVTNDLMMWILKSLPFTLHLAFLVADGKGVMRCNGIPGPPSCVIAGPSLSRKPYLMDHLHLICNPEKNLPVCALPFPVIEPLAA